MPIDQLLREAVGLFATEAAERAATITDAVLELEHGRAGDVVVVNAWTRLARELHTLKGTAATAGLDDLADVAHEMETGITALKAAALVMPPGLADTFLQATDAFVARVDAYAAGTDDDHPFPADLLRALRDDGAPPSSSSSSNAVPVSPEANASTVADADDVADIADDSAWRVTSVDILGFSRDVERLRELRLRLDDRLADLDTALADAGAELVALEGGELKRDHRTRRLLSLREHFAGVRRSLISDGEEAADVVESLEDGVKAICTLPVRSILDPLHRVVRDLCRASGKRASLSVVGGDVAIDRRLLEGLRNLLIQLVRNAVDHGVELPEVRTDAGKHAVAALVVRVEPQGNLLFLEVADDGIGLRTDAIRAAAVAARMLTSDEAAALTAAEVHGLVFRHGLSTRTQVSLTSGRGVGLDLVDTEVRALRGRIDVVSVAGQGTRFLLHVPVELGSSSLLLVRCGEQQLGIPMHAVEGVIRLLPSVLRGSRRAPSVDHRGALLPLVDLAALLDLRPAAPPESSARLLIFASDGRRRALVVDEVIGDRELVVRPLPRELQTLVAYQGAAVLAKGDLVLVLRPDWLASQEPAAASQARRVLIVDDSLTARAIHRSVLQAGGFIVHTAASVERGEEQLRRSRYDVVVCDLVFGDAARAPGGARDGLSLLTSLRAVGRDRGALFVMVSMSRDEVRRKRAHELGVGAWLTKDECKDGRLVDEIKRLLGARGSGPGTPPGPWRAP